MDLSAILDIATAAGKLSLNLKKKRETHWQWGASIEQEEAAVKIQAWQRGTFYTYKRWIVY